MPAPIDHPWFNNFRAPLYIWTIPERSTDEDLQACLVAREKWAERVNHPIAWVVDLSKTKLATGKQRKLVAAHLKRFQRCDKFFNQGSAIVVPNALVRGIVTAVFWMAPPEFPHKLFAERHAAESWAQQKLRDQENWSTSREDLARTSSGDSPF